MMKLINKTLQRPTVSLLALLSIFFIAGVTAANVAAAGQMNTDLPGAVPRTSEPVGEKRIWDWYVHPRNYAPDSLSTYSEDYTNSAQDVASSDSAVTDTKRTATATQVDIIGIDPESTKLGRDGFPPSLITVGRD